MAFRFESASFVGRLSVEHCDPELDLTALPAFVESLSQLWWRPVLAPLCTVRSHLGAPRRVRRLHQHRWWKQ
jgi:hypothetical protein